VFCVLFYVDAIAIIAEIGEEVFIVIIFSSFNYLAWLHSTLANVSTPWRRGWGTMAAMVQRQPPWIIVFLQSASMVVVFCVTNVLIPTLRRAVNYDKRVMLVVPVMNSSNFFAASFLHLFWYCHVRRKH
jgi:hypothetical protein